MNCAVCGKDKKIRTGAVSVTLCMSCYEAGIVWAAKQAAMEARIFGDAKPPTIEALLLPAGVFGYADAIAAYLRPRPIHMSVPTGVLCKSDTIHDLLTTAEWSKVTCKECVNEGATLVVGQECARTGLYGASVLTGPALQATYASVQAAASAFADKCGVRPDNVKWPQELAARPARPAKVDDGADEPVVR